MKTKSGISIPGNLSEQLQKNKSLKDEWDKLRPSCQRDYVERINKTTTTEARKLKTAKIIELTKAYAKKHPNKYKTSEKVK